MTWNKTKRDWLLYLSYGLLDGPWPMKVAKVSRPSAVSLKAVLPDWAVLNLIVRVNIGLGGWTKFGLVWGQFGGFLTYTLYRLIC